MIKLAYLVLTHEDPKHFAKLVSAIDFGCDIYVHVDKKADQSAFCQVVSDRKNVFFLQDRVSISWASISMIDAQNLLIKRALASQVEYSHLVFLSGADFPIKPVAYIHSSITSDPSREIVKYVDMRESPDGYMEHINYKWFCESWVEKKKKWQVFFGKVVRRCLRSMRFKNHWKAGIVPYFGSQWIAITPACARYIIDFQQENPWYRRMNKDTFSPDEHYYHTIIGNSPFRECADGIQQFEGRGTWRLANYHLIDPSLARYFTINDFDAVMQSDKLFVRKVRSLDGCGLVTKLSDINGFKLPF